MGLRTYSPKLHTYASKLHTYWFVVGVMVTGA